MINNQLETQDHENASDSNGMSTMCEVALNYANRGWAVIPLHSCLDGKCTCQKADCGSAGKHPRYHKEDLQKGVINATTDESVIETWWTRWPDANIGIATGKISNLFVLDVDVKQGQDGRETLRDLEEQHEKLPETVMSLTGGGGEHWLFSYTNRKISNKTRFAENLDIRGDGGYIVAPPSMHVSGREYEWEASSHPDDVQLADAPEWLLNLISCPIPSVSEAKANNLAQRIPEGSRNSKLASLAGSMRHKGMSEDAIEAALIAENAKSCDPPLPEDEVRRIARSISQYAPGNKLKSTSQGSFASNGFRLTDLGNAERLATQRGHTLRYCGESGKWYTFNDTRWQEDNQGSITRCAKETIRTMYSEAASLNDDAKRTALVKHATSSETASKINSMINLAKTEHPIPIEISDFDSDPLLFNCSNGTLDFKGNKFRQHSANDFITKMSPVSFDSTATCPTWEWFLQDIMAGNTQLIAFLQRAVGYCLTGSVSEQVVFILYGTGANGKTTFIEVVRSLLGDYAQQANSSMFLSKKYDGIPNDIARLKGVRFVSASEIENGRRLSEVTIKQLTGEDRITARFLHQEFFEFDPTHKIFIATNHKPRILGADDGIWRRIRLIPFSVRIPNNKMDRNLLTKLRAELPGVLNWAVKGCLDWQTNGLGFPNEVRTATQNYREEMDTVECFLKECCQIGPSCRVSASELSNEYRKWCDENGEVSLSLKHFAERMLQKGLAKRRDGKNGSVMWHGLRIH